MIFSGIVCILFAFGALSFRAFPAMIFWAATGSVLIALGISRGRSRQAQQQTVIVNNYITQAPPADPEQKAPAEPDDLQ